MSLSVDDPSEARAPKVAIVPEPILPHAEYSAFPRANPWWQAPRLRSAALDGEERHATWLELFFDLILVAAISQLSQSLNHDLTLAGLTRFIMLSIPIWWAWTGTTFYATRFDTDDLSDRLFYCLQMVGVAALAVSVRDGLGATSAGFALAYVFLRLLLIAQYALAAYFVPEARPLTYRYLTGFSLAALCWLFSIAVPPPQRFWLWGLGMLVDIAAPVTSGKLHSRVPPHNAHVSERYGLFIIVVLGEAVMGAVSGVSQQAHWPFLAGVSAVLGLVIAFSLWWLYFDHASSAPARAVTRQGKVWLYQTWLYMHLPLMVGLSALGVAIQQVVLTPQHQALSPMVQWLFCGGAALSFLAVGAIHVTSCYVGTRLELKIGIPYALTALGILLLGAFTPGKAWPVFWSLMLAGIATYNVVLHIFRDRNIQNRACALQ